MSALQTAPGGRPGLKVTVGRAAVAIGALAAIAVAVLFLAVSGGGNTRTVRAAQPSAPAPPLIQYRGTGQSPIVTSNANASPRYTRADHEHGLVP